MSQSAAEKAKFRGALEGSDVTDGQIKVLLHRRMLPLAERVEPHHLAPNAFLKLSAYVTLCEGFVGIEPRLDLWQKLFFFKQQSTPTDDPDVKKMTPCGAALVHHRSASGFPKLPLQDSVKKWQRGFFYVKNVDP
ncbi:hypothetical protein D1007_36877 [Hordeum vulgare]|nr:hypothetical protein D1007_36877 [Hordeum vulgare]